MCCWLFVVGCLVPVVCCLVVVVLVSVARCAALVVRCLSSGVWRWLCVACCVLFVAFVFGVC